MRMEKGKKGEEERRIRLIGIIAHAEIRGAYNSQQTCKVEFCNRARKDPAPPHICSSLVEASDIGHC